MTHTEWRAHRGISKATHHKLKREGVAPDELVYPGTSIQRITPQADLEWERRMRALAKKKSAELEEARARRVEKSKLAAQAAIQSPRHQANKSVRRKWAKRRRK
jgi:hypothetical protein